jgi:hypothetical protein
LWLNSALSPQLPPGPAQIVTLSLQSLYRSRWRNLVNKNCTTKSKMSATHNASTLCPVEEGFPTVRPRRRIRVLLADSSPGFRNRGCRTPRERGFLGNCGSSWKCERNYGSLRRAKARFAFDRPWASNVCWVNNHGLGLRGFSAQKGSKRSFKR